MEDHSPSSHGALPGKQDPWRTAAATTFGLGLACLPVALAAHWMLTRVCPNLAFTQNRPETFWESLTAHAVFPAYLAGALMLAAILLRWVGGRMQPGRLVVIVICMALAVRWTTPDMALDLSPPPDALHYAALASRFVSQGEHTIPIGPHAHGLPSRFAPGLSLFLAASQWHYPGHLGSGIYCMWLAGALTIGLLWRVGRRLFSPHVGALAALFLALSPSYAYNTRHIMGDVPWSLAVLGACSLIMLARGRKWWLFAGGFVLGAGMLIKQPHLGIIGSIGAGYLVYMAYHPEGRWRNALTIGAGLILGLMPWLLYNRLVIGDWLLSGYHVHDPVMNTAQEAFGLRYVFGPPVVKGVMGNLLYYPLSLLGLEPQVARMLFPLPVSIFAAVALVHRWRHPPVTASWSGEARWFLTVSGIAGRTTKFGTCDKSGKILLAKYMHVHIFAGMNTTPSTPADILRQIASIHRMEPGKLCVMREGKSGTYYNHQYREDGRARSVYVPRDQVEAVRENTENYGKFQSLVEQYAGQIVTETRAERLGTKKKRQTTFSPHKTKNSKG